MIKKIFYTLAISASIASVAAVAANKSKQPISIAMSAYVVQHDKAGNEVLKAAKTAEPGQKIQYQLVYKNSGNKAYKAGAITGPIPANTHYLAKTTRTKVRSQLLVSIDGGKTYESEPVKRMKKMANGKMKSVVIPASKYTHVRWKPANKIQAGEKQLYNFRVQVNN